MGRGHCFLGAIFSITDSNYGNFVIIESRIAAEEVELATDCTGILSIYCSPASPFYG